MTPSPAPSPPPRHHAASSWRGWRYSLVATVGSAALVVSSLTFQAAADEGLPQEPTSTTEPSPSTDPTPAAEPTESPSSSAPSEEPSSDAPSEEPSEEPTKSGEPAEDVPTGAASGLPSDAPSEDPTKAPSDPDGETPPDPADGPIGPGGTEQSLFATGGTGAYKGSIDWFEWGTAGQAIPAAGTAKTNTRMIAGQTLATTCTMGAPTGGSLQAYRSGSFSGDGLDDMYNIGGTGASNQLVAGLSNTVSGVTIDFSFTCSATLGGFPVPLAGLVMADAEASSGAAGEYVQATIPAGADWRLIDRFRAPASCAQSTPATRTGQTLRLGGTTGCATAYPTTVAFMDGATSAAVQIRGGGVSAIALGVVLFSDFGDAPAGYGEAGSLYSPPFTGGVLAQGTTSVFAAGTTLATPSQPATRLGATADSESSQQSSAGATGDGADEDAVGALATLDAVPGATYTLPTVACTGPGSVAGWIDWNRNGTFDTGERSGPVTCSGSSVSLSWTNPVDVRSGATFVRLRIGPDAVSVADPTGVTTAGEVEDHPLAVLAPADLGDAPASYGTTMAGAGPRHDVPGYDGASHTSPLMLGASIDTDADGVPGAAANGDDGADIDDETALPSLAIAPGATTASATVPVVNTSGATATLYGWIDTNGNGTFQVGEAATVAVPDAATSATLSWSGLPPALPGTQPVVRLRLTSTTLTDTVGTAALDERTQGAAFDGEVEDSLAAVGQWTDFGDAPATYGTATAVNGAAHLPVGYNATNQTSALMLGARIDAELDGVPSAGADGDDAAGVDDEDGVAFNTDVTASGRLETVYVTASAAGFLNGWIDFDRDGDFDSIERVFNDTALVAGVNRRTYLVPTGATFEAGPSYARFRITAAAGQVTSPNGAAPTGEVEDYARTLFDPQATALNQCPAGSQPQPVTVIQNPSFETYTGTFANTSSAATINFSQNWFDAHTTGGQYHVFSPTFDSGPVESTMPFRAGADGYGFLGGHTASGRDAAGVTNDAGEGATNTLVSPLAPGTAYVGFFSIGAGGYSRNGSGYVRLVGVNNKSYGSVPQTGTVVNPTPTNQEFLADTPTVAPAGAGTRAQWSTATFSFTPAKAWPYLRVEARNANPANNGTAGGQTWMSFDDFQLFACNPVPTDFGDAAGSFGTTVAQDGPRHLITGYDAGANTSTLMLGAKVDDEGNGVPGAAANGDDSAGVDDEDVATMSVSPGATTASVTVPLVNSTGGSATLYGWVDTNGNGSFQASEAATVTVPDGATSASLNWTGLTPAVDGAQVAVRLRLTSGTLIDAAGTATLDERSQGAAPDGEVEDSLAAVAAVLPNDCANPLVDTFGAGIGRAALPAGQTTYTFAATGNVVDGSYALVPGIDTTYGGWWHTGPDHTPGDTSGRAMLVNAALAAGKFFSKTFTGLDVGSTYDFSAWITNANNAGSVILPNVKFQVIDPNTGAVLATVDTGNLPNQTSLIWTRYGLSFTATQTTVRLELVNNALGGGGNDLALDDVGIGQLCEYGDAPNSYGTLLASVGPVHGQGAPRLGVAVDYEGDGHPTAAADGDDANATDDEDGVSFNPTLGYPNPTIRTGTDPVTLLPVQNTVRVNASAAGFASVWVDWNEDGDFADAGERVADAQAVTAGDNDVTFPGAANPADIRTYVRVRYSTDAASIHTPTGAAPDGEVEDYQVLVERLVMPAACSPVTDPYYAFTFNTVTEQAGAGAPGTSARYPNAGVVGGQVIDVLAATGTGTGAATINANGFLVSGDDVTWQLNSGGSNVAVTFTFVRAGTTTPVSVNTVWTVNDLDGGERTDYIPAELAAGYAITPGSKVVVSSTPGGRLIFAGTVASNGDPNSRYQVWFQNKSSIAALWRGNASSGFAIDADGDLSVSESCDDYGDAPDSYQTLLASDGPHHTVVPGVHVGADAEFDGDGQPSAGADGDDTNRVDDEDGVTFNPALGYPNPTIRTGTDPVTLLPVQNTVRVNASAPGFASVWVDWNEDGDFADAGERVSDAQAVTAGDNDVTFPGAANPADIRTYVRVRYSTDAASIHQPTGAAPDGEVEDYQVLVERLIVPSACVPVSQPFYAMTFQHPTINRSGAGEPGTTARWPEVTVVGGRAVDMVATEGTTSQSPGLFGNSFASSGDDAIWSLNLGAATNILYAFYLTGTTTPLAVNAAFTVDDLDMGETTIFSTSDVAGYAITPGSAVKVTAPTPAVLRFDGTNASPSGFVLEKRYQFWFQNKSAINILWGGGQQSAFGFDGDADLALPPSCEDYGDAPDSYKTLLASGGPGHAIDLGLRLGTNVEFDGDGQPTAGANGDDLNRTDDEDGVAAPIPQSAGQATSVQVSATNNTATEATLAGWLDLNSNGTFDPAERVVTPVPANSSAATYALSFPVSLTNADTYARFRLLPGAVPNPLPTGAASAGEVEDYVVTGTVPVVTCMTDPALFNTAYDGIGGKATVGTLDRNWQVALGNATGPASATGYVPAWVVTRHPAWYAGTFNNASWISKYVDTKHSGNVDLYFRYPFQIAPEVSLSSFALPMEFFADNSVPDVWVNGVSQDPFETGLPMTTGNPYQYGGFVLGGKASTSLSHGFQHGANTIVVRVASGQDAAGFMAQINAKALCTDRGDAPDTYGTTGATGASHGLAGYDDTAHTSALMIGAKIDAEADGVPGVAATGDDTAGVDDEDGVGPITVTKGSAPSVDLTVTNTTGGPATLAGWVDLDKSGTFDANERAVATVAPAPLDGAVTLTFAGAVTTTQATYARFRLFPGVVSNPLSTGQAASGEVEDYTVTTLTPSLTVAKTSDATASSKPGDTVHYTVTLTNIGSGAYTAANPARLVDDLTGVLDDGTYQADAAATVDGGAVTAPTYAAPRVSWSGPLAAGKSVVVTYSVVLGGGGDGHVRNTAFAPLTPTPGPTPDCSTPGAVPCDTELTELPKLTITKTANRTQLPSVGQTIVYTVTVANTGLGDFTAAHLATFSDDLSAVLDDTQPLLLANITATSGTATFTSPTLSWSGPLPAGQSATIIYTLTYTGLGDQQLVNNACIPADEAMDPADTCRTVSVPGSGLRHHKSVDPASGTSVDVGQVLTYTLTFENVGPVAAPVDTSDDLSDVLDDAQLVGTPIAGPGLTAAVAGNQLEITGSVPAGQTRTVTYQVEVRPWADQDDHVLANVLACEPGEPAGCAPEETTNPVRHVALAKTSDATVDSKPGDPVTYTVTATNDGEGDWTTIDPATLVDDLTGVLDDADYDGTTIVSSGATTYAAPRITWTGALAHGDTVTIEYTVTLTGGGDGHVDNVAWQPGPGGPGPTPDCATSPRPCAEHGYDLPKLTIDKTSNRTKINADGDQITYTVTVSNPGPGAYTAAHPATFSDDLSDVLDDATFDAGSITATTGSATLNGTSLDWSGVLAAGASATVTYTVTYDSSLGGDFVVDNSACIPQDEALDPADDCRTVKTPGSGLRETKRVDPASGTPVVEGQVLTYMLSFQNVGAAAATVDNVDDLTDVIDDATLQLGSITADVGLTATPNGAGDQINIVGSVPVGETLTVSYQVTLKAYADQGDHLVANALGCEPLDVPCVPTTTSNPVRHLTLTKTSDATADSQPGDTVSYTVRLVNDGAGDYTAADPATLVDDLTGVLDDATFNGVAHASAGPDPTYLTPRIIWSGPLASGDEVRVTYEVVLKGGGDGHVDNVAWVPPDPTDPGPTPDCSAPATTFPCGGESSDLPKLVITKDASETELTATGQTVTYTIVVANPGPGDYTAAHLAGFGDDLSDVVDDAEIDPASVTATTGTATFLSPLLAWTGELPAGQSATITYTATYRATGNHVLDNTACVPTDEARTAAERCDSAHVDGSALTHAKSVSPASGTAVEVGDVLTYTLTFTNTGTVPADVSTSDDLSDVLDDATLDTGSITAGAGLNAVPSGTNLNVTGTVPAGAIRTVTYQVTVNPFDQQGDHVLTNALACEPGDPAPCDPETTSNQVAHLVIAKSSDRTVDSEPGDPITYTVTATNDGPGDFTGVDPASVVDDLAGVLDDADYSNDAASDRGAAPTYAAPRITWSGALTSNDTVTISYTVVLKGGGDGIVRNVAWQPVDPGNPGPTPDCAVTPRPCDTSSFDLPKLTVAKSASRADLPATGETVTYTVVVTNPGPGDYTVAHPATMSDDLSDVLDDATAGPVSASVGTASITGTTLSWTGVLAATESATITYTFTYRATGNHGLDNTACVPAAEAQVPADACDTVSVPGSGLVHAKSVSPASGTAVEVGDVLTYTLTFDNTAGTTAASVNTHDDLSAVLDDAALDTGSVTAGAGLAATPSGNNLDVTGTVPAGATRTVTYQVTVRAFAQQGDHVITNALACEPGEPVPCAPETTSNPVRHVVLTKVKASPAAPDTGDTVTYTLTAHNDGAGDWTAGDPASFVDDLTGVLDDATWDNTATATAGTVAFASPQLTWSGALAHGTTVTVTYGVTVTNQGDHELANTASVPGCQLAECTPPTVVTPLPHVVPDKTSTPATGQPVQPGDVITYRLSWTNDGTAPGVVDSTDDLTGVLDDAVVVVEPTSSNPSVTATRTGATLRVVGPIAVGGTVTVTYQVKVRPSGEHGDNHLANVLAQDTPQVTCPPFPCTPVPPPATEHAAGDLDDWKTVDPAAGTPVKPGRRLTYTLHFDSVGTGPVTVAREDDLSGVLDDATLVSAPASSSPALTVTGPTAGRIAVNGTLSAGASATVTYTVEVKHDGQRGDDQLGNFLLDPGQQPPASCSNGAMRAAASRPDCTVNGIRPLQFDLRLDKKVVSSTTVEGGDKVRYRLQVSNNGPDTAPAPIVLRDPLPAGLELVSAHGKGWDCKVKTTSDLVVCRRDKDLAAHKNAHPVFVVARVAEGISGRIVNKAKVKAAGDVSPANNRDIAPVTVSSVPELPNTGFRLRVPKVRFEW